MIGQTSFGGIVSTGQATAQAVTTSAAQLVITGGVAMPSTSDRTGSPSVKADPTNNRLVFNAPGIYKVELNAVGVGAAALQTTMQLRKNGASGAAFGSVSKNTWATAPNQQNAFFIVEILASDIPAAGGVATFSDPSAAAGAYKPGGGFAGAGAAPLTGVPVDVLVTGDGAVNLTLSDVRFYAERIG